MYPLSNPITTSLILRTVFSFLSNFSLTKCTKPLDVTAVIPSMKYIVKGFLLTGTFHGMWKLRTRRNATAEFYSISGVFLYAKIKRAVLLRKWIWESVRRSCWLTHPRPMGKFISSLHFIPVLVALPFLWPFSKEKTPQLGDKDHSRAFFDISEKLHKYPGTFSRSLQKLLQLREKMCPHYQINT